jgi:hypothetical protein
MSRLRGFSKESRAARTFAPAFARRSGLGALGLGALGLVTLLCAGGVLAEEPPKPATTTSTAAPGTPGPSAKGLTAKPLGASPHGPQGPHGPHGPDAAKATTPGDKSAEAPKGPTSPEERATRSIERARERLEASAKLAETEEAEPDAKTRAQRRAARRAFLRAQHDLRKASGKKFELKGEQKDQVKAKLEKELKASADTRAKRLADDQAKVKKAYGPALGHPPIRRELRRSAWRVARLERAKDIAEAADQKELVERANTLLAAEKTRHDARMKQLMALWKKAGSPKGTLPSQAAASQAGAPEGSTPKAVAPVTPKPTPTPAPSTATEVK